MVLFIFCRKQLKPGKESTVNSTTYVLSVQEAKVSFRIMVLKPKEQVSDLTSLGKDGKAWLTLFWLQIWSTVLTSLTSVEISSLISVKAKLDQTLCLHLLEPCSPWLSLENRGGDLRAVSLLWGLPGNLCQAAPLVWSLPSVVTGPVLWQAGMSICSLESHLHWQSDGTTVSLSLSSESSGNTLEPLPWAAAPRIILLHTRESHRNSVMHLCPHLPIQSVASCLSFSYHGFLWAPCLGGDWSYCSLADSEAHIFLQADSCLWHRQCVGCDSEGQAMVFWKPVKSRSICLCLGKEWNILRLQNFFLVCKEKVTASYRFVSDIGKTLLELLSFLHLWDLSQLKLTAAQCQLWGRKY